MLQYRTDLAMEAHELLCAKSRAQTLSGVDSRTVFRRGCSVTSVRIDTEGAARQLGKPRGRYVTLDLSPLQKNADDVLERASRAVGAELRALLGENVKSVLVAGLGNASMTPDAIGPRSAEHVLVTRHLRQNGAFSAFCSVSVLTPGVLGRTGIEAMETLRGTVRAVQPTRSSRSTRSRPARSCGSAPRCSSLTRASSQAAAWAITGVPSAATRSACRSTPSAFPRSSTRRR